MNALATESNQSVESVRELLLKAHSFRQHSEKNDDVDENINLISFKLLNEDFGIDLNSLQEILKAKSISKVPGSADYLQGMINLRGNLITVVDLKRRLGLKAAPITESSRVMIVRHQERSIGLLVDKVLEIVKLPLKDISDPSSSLLKAEMSFIKEIGRTADQVIAIPDLKEIFQSLV